MRIIILYIHLTQKVLFFKFYFSTLSYFEVWLLCVTFSFTENELKTYILFLKCLLYSLGEKIVGWNVIGSSALESENRVENSVISAVRLTTYSCPTSF